jgi:trans-aconitate 2-methyltransferase
MWDAAQYERFAAERERPFHDLMARVPPRDVRFAADLGCGTGKLTRTLLARWPQAVIYGVDNSAEMLRAATDASDARLSFVLQDLAEWQPPRPLDCIVSNAALHWLPDHAQLVPKLVTQLAPAGVLAVQMPNNRAEMPHRALAELIGESPWRECVPPQALAPGAEGGARYVERLSGLGLTVDCWETIYYHALPSTAAVVEWLKGTTLRPILTVLEPDVAATFLRALTERLVAHYPALHGRVIFPFRRLFFVACRP